MEPMTMLAIGSALAGGVSSIMGGKAQGAAIRRQNEQAHRNWIQANTQKAFNNSREQFQSTYAFEQQLKRNNAIAENAYAYQFDAKNATQYNYAIAQNQLADAMQNQRAALTNAVLSKGISGSSGSYAMLATTQALNAISKSGQMRAALDQEKAQIDKQFKGMMAQQTENIFMPNIQLYDESPLFGDAGAAEAAGLVSGALQIGGAAAAAFGSSKQKSTPNPSEGTNSFGFQSTSTFNPSEGTNSFNTNLDSYDAPSGSGFGNSQFDQSAFA